MKYLFSLLLLSLVFISLSGYSQNEIQDFEPLNLGKVYADIDTIKQQMDSPAQYMNATYEILLLEFKEFGIVKTIQMNSNIFLPFLVFVGFFFLWLRSRKRC